VINFASPTNILHRNRLPGSGIIGDSGHAQRDAVRPHPLDQILQPLQIHVALKRQIQLGVIPFRDGQINRVCAKDKQVCLGCVKMAVIGHDLAGFHQRLKKHAFRRPSLMRGQHTRKTQHFLHSALKMREAARASIRFIPAHNTRPLGVAHRAGSAVGQQVHKHIFRGHGKQVVVRVCQRGRALFAGGDLQFFYNFYAEWFDEWNGHRCLL